MKTPGRLLAEGIAEKAGGNAKGLLPYVIAYNLVVLLYIVGFACLLIGLGLTLAGGR